MKIKQRSHQRLKDNLRWDMVQLLDAVDHGDRFSHLVIDQYLDQSRRSLKDKNLVVRVVYGSIQRRLTLDYFLSPFIKGQRPEAWVQSLLRLSIYQALYLDRIPQHAIVNEAVEIAKVNGHQGLGKYVNAILRNFFRQGPPAIEAIQEENKRWSIQYSLPVWLVDYLVSHLPSADFHALAESLNQLAHLSIRVNHSKDQVMKDLAALGLGVEPSQLADQGIRVMGGNPIHTACYQKGAITIQDESSMLVAPLGQLRGDEAVLDACAAPGGKATQIASYLTTGHLQALDLSASKLKKLAQHAERMGLQDKLTIQVADARYFVPDTQMLYDVIYLDAPCSGLGLMRRKPEIKYQKSKEAIQSLVNLQAQLLDHVAGLLKPGGRLIYSTCSIAYEENEWQVNAFIDRHPDFARQAIQKEEVKQADLITDQGDIRIWPHQYETDGFFISRLSKKSD